jgi:imidazolonepropionase-like amidohydrolase
MRVPAVCPGMLLLLILRCTSGQTPSDLTIVHANVVDVRTGSVENDATVVISGSKIKAVLFGKSSKAATGARVVDAHGGYLIPGLWDMHVHSEGDNRVLRLMLASGITGIRDMGGDVYKLAEARRHIEARDWDGPRVLFAGPMLEGPPGESDDDMWIEHTPEEGQRAVASLAALHVDFIKVHDHLSRDVYFAIASAAKKARLPFAGHVTASISPLEASDAGQASIEHFEFLPKVCVPLLGEKAAGDERLPDDCTRASTEALLRHLAANGTWLDPTLQSFRFFAPLQWKQILAGFNEIGGQIRSEHIRMLAGTDWSEFLETKGARPGWCLHDELDLWVAVGFTPLQALQAATLNPAIFLAMEDSMGTIEAGKVADLVLVQGNPLIDIDNTRRVVAVIARGTLFDRSRLSPGIAKARTCNVYCRI